MMIQRQWAMPSADTFSIPCVSALLDKYLKECAVVVDPFARNSTRGTLRNDLNPQTTAEHHMDARDFCRVLRDRGIVADAVLFDPPYSPRQIAECYAGIGKKVTREDTQNARTNREVRSELTALLRPGGVAISFGWNSGGFGGASYATEEIMLVPHGGAHNDTIVVVERKLQGSLFGGLL